jgi:hypothetical protein
MASIFHHNSFCHRLVFNEHNTRICYGSHSEPSRASDEVHFHYLFFHIHRNVEWRVEAAQQQQLAAQEKKEAKEMLCITSR